MIELKRQLVNAGVGALANVGAKQIGSAYHTGQINKTEQLIFHALLGAGTNALTGNDALSGAVSGVVGEVVAETTARAIYNKTTNFNSNEKNILKEIGGLAGGISSLFVGKANGLDINDVRNNIYAGYRVGKNAAENNLGYDQLLGNSRTTSDYRRGRMHPTLNVVRDHNGVDVVPAEDNNNRLIHAAADGVSEGSYTQRDADGNITGWGNYTVVRHVDADGNEYLTRYAHMEDNPGIERGTIISEGQNLGVMGNTGNSSGAHLHYEIQRYNSENQRWEYIDPQLPENNIGNYERLEDTPYQQNLNRR